MNTDTPTPRTDKCLTFDSIAICETLERELAAVTEQRDEALSDLEFRRDLFVLQEQQLNDVRAERDRLAEALRVIIIEEESCYREHAFNATVAREALAAVKGGADELQR